MAKIAYSTLGLKPATETKKFTFNEKEIEVLSYLPIEDKNDLVAITLQKSDEDGIYNEVLMEMYFHLNLVYLYTNITFTDKQKENEPKLYDTMLSSGFMAAFLTTLGEDEYSEVFNMLQEVKNAHEVYERSTAAIVKKLIVDFPQNAKIAAETVENFNPEQYQRLLNFAKVNGYADQSGLAPAT